MEQDGDWTPLDFDQDLMTPGFYNLGGKSMDSLSSELDDLLPPWTGHDVSVNAPRVQRQALGYEPAAASSGYHTVSHSELSVLTR
jgi:hypothetical protein